MRKFKLNINKVYGKTKQEERNRNPNLNRRMKTKKNSCQTVHIVYLKCIELEF